MKEPITLTEQELIALTGKTMRSAQVRALRNMSLSYQIRPDGSPVVSRKVFEQWCGLRPDSNHNNVHINLDFLNASKKKAT
ncbi:DUF4224 domain-containing protein [Sedimenticola sp.]|uniref:DUF4224 domain-containing protein n=1 Tax=Sedimenticola sp. TaxID=1940285 RepID=UPI003D102BE6